MRLRRPELAGEVVNAIYLGGGTPSLLRVEEIEELLNEVYQNYTVAINPEITVEANPDDLSSAKICALAASPVNRLSIGIQSFFEPDLRQMNRSHNAAQALKCLEEASKYFKNTSIDLIYGVPGMTDRRWRQNLEIALSFTIPHISAYSLTVEPKTALAKFIENGTFSAPDEGLARQHFFSLIEILEDHHFIHYELSNFGKPGFFSRNNTAYWNGEFYLGIGPSAHSYNGAQRSWNVASNAAYSNSLQEDILPLTTETLTPTDRYNEYIMIGLRTIQGVSPQRVEEVFGTLYKTYLLQQVKKYIQEGLLVWENEHTRPVIKTAKKGKFLTDGIASNLFMVGSP